MNLTDWLQLFTLPIQEQWQSSQFLAPTPIQAQLFPLISEGFDLIAESPTGSGKTLAYLLPLIQKIDAQQKNPQLLVVAPSRELVMQVERVAKVWATPLGLEVASFIGSADINRQVEKLKQRPQIIIGTLQRILDLIQLKKLKMHEIKTIIFDEGDQTITTEQMEAIHKLIKTTKKSRQIIIVSATIPTSTEELAITLMREPHVIKVSRTPDHIANVNFFYMRCAPLQKTERLIYLLKTSVKKGLVFINTRNFFTHLTQRMEEAKLNVRPFYNDLKKSERETTLNHFREGRISSLLVTDLAARGLDINDLSHVIHFDLPLDWEQFLHRSGRTGRMGREGTVIVLITSDEEERLLFQFAKKLDFTPVKTK